VKLNSSITLLNVLFVPGLTCNIISIAQLIDDLICTVTFTPKLCVIQDLSLRSTIGVGKQRIGVYLFQEEVEANQVKTCDLWHQRLGHRLKEVMTLISSRIGLFENKGTDEPCDVCFKPKQTRLYFPLSNSKAINCFHLIHYDIWGGYKIESFGGVHYFFDHC